MMKLPSFTLSHALKTNFNLWANMAYLVIEYALGSGLPIWHNGGHLETAMVSNIGRFRIFRVIDNIVLCFEVPDMILI